MSDHSTSGGLLCKLQLLQREFDETRGFNFEKALTGISQDTKWPTIRSDFLLQFTALALCGEAGELANTIKKAVRASMLHQESKAERESACSELGDILAYLLKISNLLNEDLAIQYLQQMCENTLRFPARTDENSRIFVLAGPSGAGKSTVVLNLHERLEGLGYYLEKFEKNPYLVGALASQEQNSVFQSQQWFLRQQKAFFDRAPVTGPVVVEQDPAAIVLVYARKFCEEGQLQIRDYETLLTEFLEFEIDLSKSHGRRVTIFLDAPAELLWKRAQMGSKVPQSLRWFEDLRARFSALYSRIPNCVVIDTDRYSAREVTAMVEEIIRSARPISAAGDTVKSRRIRRIRK